MSDEKFTRSVHDQCVYVKMINKEEYLYLLLYVDDMLIAAKSMSEVNKLKKRLSEEFEMKDLGAASKILGIEITRDRRNGVLCLSQSGYLEKILERFNMSGSKPAKTPIGTHFKLSAVQDDSECVDTNKTPYASAVGSIMYSMIGTRPDLAFAIGLVSRFMGKPGAIHWEAVKWLLRYIKGSQNLSLVYTKGKDLNIIGYCDSDHGGDLDKQRSTSGYVFTVGGNTISWKSCLQSVVALSSTEAEFIALTEAVKEAIWVKGLLEDIGFQQDKVQVWSDSQSAICLSKNSVFHERTKHMARKRAFLSEIIEKGEIEVVKIHTSINPADMLTKCIPVKNFESALDTLKLVEWK